ncbi:uncharacterized protein LOC144146975 isoform X1 [Haemaphysalis longicornis]
MVILFSPVLFCMFTPLTVNAEVCGGSTGQVCNASALKTYFETVHLAASTSNQTLGLCITLVFQPNDQNTIHYKLANGTEIFEDTESKTYSEVPDLVYNTLASDPNTTYVAHLPFADYDACFVGKFDDALLGCRLWIKDSSTTSQITACMDGFSEVCPGTAYDTWDEGSCTNTTES